MYDYTSASKALRHNKNTDNCNFSCILSSNTKRDRMYVVGKEKIHSKYFIPFFSLVRSKAAYTIYLKRRI